MQHLKEIIIQGDEEHLLRELLSIAESNDDDNLENELLLHQRNLSNLADDFRKQVITREEYLADRNHISQSILTLVDHLEHQPNLKKSLTKVSNNGYPPSTQKGINKRIPTLFLSIALALTCATVIYFVAMADATPEKIELRFATTWDPLEGSIFKDELTAFQKELEDLTEGDLTIKIIPLNQWQGEAKDYIKKVNKGEIDGLFSVAYNWIDPTIPEQKVGYFFAAIPFGKEFDENMDWLFAGDGLDLWQRYYDEVLEMDVIVQPFGHSGAQYGGWFKFQPVLDSIQFLKMRIPPLQGELLERIGAEKSVFCSQKEIKKLMEDNAKLTGAEWSGPHEDFILRLHHCQDNGFKYYIKEGWHEPNNAYELLINKKAYQQIPKEQQAILQVLIQKYNYKIYQRFQFENERVWNVLKEEEPNLILLEHYPEDTKNALHKEWKILREEMAAHNSFFAEVLENYEQHSKEWGK